MLGETSPIGPRYALYFFGRTVHFRLNSPISRRTVLLLINWSKGKLCLNSETNRAFSSLLSRASSLPRLTPQAFLGRRSPCANTGVHQVKPCEHVLGR